MGDHELVRNLLEKGGPGKFRPYWEQDIYVVVDRPLKDLSVYDVTKLNGTGRVRILHSLLLLCNSLPFPDSSQETRRKPARRYRKQKPNVIQESSDSSSDVDVTITTPAKQLNSLAKVFTSSGGSGSSVQEVPPAIPNAQNVEPITVSGASSSFQSTNEQRVDTDADNLPAMSTDEEAEESDDRMSDNEDETTTNDVRTTRVRRQPKIFTYDTLGQPNIRKCSVRLFYDRETFV